MPSALLKPCKFPGCSVLLQPGEGSACATHRGPDRSASRARDQARGSSASRGYGYRWQLASKRFLDSWPLCMGILIPTPDWSEEHAIEFCNIRHDEWVENGNFSSIAHACRAYLSLHPIYTIEPWDVGQPATVVDHIVPHKGNDALFWAQWNWQPATDRAHNKKTSREDRGAWSPSS